MGLLYMDGFEGYSSTSDMIRTSGAGTCRITNITTTNANISLNTSPIRTSQVTPANSRSLYCTLGEAVHVNLPDVNEVIIGFGFYNNYTAAALNNSLIAIGGNNPGSASQGVIFAHHTTTGVIAAYTNSSGNPGTLLGAATGTYGNLTWYYIEVRVKVGTTTGEVKIRINGVEVLSLANVNTATGSLSSYSGFALTGERSMYYDDLYVCDTTGSVNNDFLGPVSVYTLMPTANGSTTNLTAVGAGSNWGSVSEVSADTTTYVETSTTGNKDYYEFEDLPGGVSTVLGVATRAKATTPDSGGRKIKLNMKNGANVISSALRTLTMSSWLYEFFLSETAPDGSAWTKSSVDATEVGPEAG